LTIFKKKFKNLSKLLNPQNHMKIKSNLFENTDGKYICEIEMNKKANKE
jgi:hypothetical protein